MTTLTARSRAALSALVLLTLSALGCSSSTGTDGSNNNSSAYYIRFTVNGTQTEYRDQVGFPVVGSFAHVGTEYSAVVTGSAAVATGTGGTVTLSAIDVAPITTKTYGAIQPAANNGFTIGQISYAIGGVGYANSDPNNDEHLTFTEITATTVRGTFSGTLKASGHPNISISGEFFAKRIS